METKGYKISDMTDEGRRLLSDMKEEVSAFNDLMNALGTLVALKKFFDSPISGLLDFVLPGKNEWDGLTEVLGNFEGFKGILKNKFRLHWHTFQTRHSWNPADRAFISALYDSVIES